jgi:uncharacterized protein YbbK (DUF523 family)
MLLPRHPEALARIRRPTADDPLRVLVSGCMIGWNCTNDGTSSGMAGALGDFVALPTVRIVPFCPEDVGIGTPRGMPDIHGGDGRDVVAGTARVLDENGNDLTTRMLAGCRAMLAHALDHRVELAILTDMSAACGSQVISDGCRLRPDRRYQRGPGVAAALLADAGIPVLSQRDRRTLGHIRSLLEPGFVPDPSWIDHHESEWFRSYFGEAR